MDYPSLDVFSSPGTQPPFLKVKVTIEGLPDDVQRIADALDIRLSNPIGWDSFGRMKADNLLELSGYSMYDDAARLMPDMIVYSSLNV